MPNFFSPTGISFAQAAPQVTHLGIGAHQDDLEIMALHGILECYKNPTQHFGGIICTSGSGSPRTGPYATYSDQQMKACRQEEQRQAARTGEYLFIAHYDFPSIEVQKKNDTPLAEALYEMLRDMHPKIIYTHHPLDKHPTHRAVCAALIQALRRLPKKKQPQQLLGVEVWRSLDWVTDADKIVLDVSAHPELSKKLIAIFNSQIAGGKRYDLATEGRQRANATYANPHTTDHATLASYAIDLMPLLNNEQLMLREFALGFVKRFQAAIEDEQRSMQSNE